VAHFFLGVFINFGSLLFYHLQDLSFNYLKDIIYTAGNIDL